jgi:voltage-gated potassium channel
MTAETANHVIICGFGLVGEKIFDILQQHSVDVVVIEVDKDKVEALHARGVKAIAGDATSSKVLREAGVEKAKAMAVAMDDDAKNLFAIITARSINPNIVVATRANDELMKEKLKEAGAKFVATPNRSASEELFKQLVETA